MNDSTNPLAIPPNPRLRNGPKVARLAPSQTLVRAVPAGAGGAAANAEGGNAGALNQKLIAALTEIAECLEAHPAYMPDVTDKEIEEEGGDAAEITYLAQIARKALGVQ